MEMLMFLCIIAKGKHDQLRSMYDKRFQIINLNRTNLRLRSHGVQNRVRRVIREEMHCPGVVKIQNLRLDFIIETPPSWDRLRKEVHLSKVSEQLKVKTRGE